MAEIIEHVLQKKGFIRRTIREEFIGDQSDTLRKASKSAPSTIYRVAIADEAGGYVHIQLRGRQQTAFSRLKYIKFNTFWRVFGEAKDRCFPCWQKITDLDFGATYLWQIPNNMGVWLVAVYDMTGTTLGHPGLQINKVYLVTAHTAENGLFRLPLCNVYTDASVCMGGYREDYTKDQTILDRYKSVLTHFKNSPWNSHLQEYHKEEQTKAVFTMGLDGKKQIDIPTKWETFSTKVNSTFYSDLGLQQLTQEGSY